MSDDTENDNFMQSTLRSLMQKNNDDELDSISSLSDLIKAHESNFRPSIRNSEDNNLSNLASKKLNIKDENSRISSILKSHNISNNEHLKDSDQENNETEDFSTLEEYTKSFLLSKGSSSVPSRRFQGFSSTLPVIKNVIDSKSDVFDSDLINKNRLSPNEQSSKSPNIESVGDSSTFDNWNFDLSIALQETNERKSLDNDVTLQTKKYESKVYAFHIHECILDISFLADEKLAYNSTVLSPFGYVLNRTWKKTHIAKKYRSIGSNWPYKKSQCFKFDSLSPDDLILKTYTKTKTTSINDS